MKSKIFALTAVASALILAGCGGGGGSAGTVGAEYKIALRTDKAQLPVNVSGISPGIGTYAPFTTVLHVDASIGGAAIPDGEKTFSCNVSDGLNYGSLYYLDGNKDHEREVDDGNGGKITVPNSYRSIVLGSNAGGASFHFHAGDKTGTSRITCSVTDPRDKQQKSASVDIVVGAATGKPANVRLLAARDYIGTQNNLNGVSNQSAVQAFVLDDANQPTTSVSGANVQVRILPVTSAATDARLVAGVQSGKVLQLPSIGGVATFSLLGGTDTGPVFLEFAADRFDNIVTNGIQDPMVTVMPVYVLDALTSNPVLQDVDLGDVTKGAPYTSLLTVRGGLPPYVWSATGLPSGLILDSATGMISGKIDASAAERNYVVAVKVMDKNKLTATANIRLNVISGLPEDFSIGGCNSNQVCNIGSAMVGRNFSYAFTSSVPGITWGFAGLPGWLKPTMSESAGVLGGTPTPTDCGNYTMVVTAKKGVAVVTRTMSLTVVDGPGAGNACQ